MLILDSPIVTAAAPLIDRQSERSIWELPARILTWIPFQQRINEVKLGQTGFLVLMSGSGNILYYPDRTGGEIHFRNQYLR